MNISSVEVGKASEPLLRDPLRFPLSPDDLAESLRNPAHEPESLRYPSRSFHRI